MRASTHLFKKCTIVGFAALALVAASAAAATADAARPGGTFETQSSNSQQIVNLAPPASCAGVKVGVADDLSVLVERNPDGTTFCVSPGLHRLSRAVVLKGHDRVVGAPGAILDGSRLLQNFVKSGPYWVATGQTQESAYLVGQCAPAYPACKRPEDVYFDDRPLRHVASLTDLVPGSFYFDYPGDRIYLADDPAGHKVEAAVVGNALKGYAYGGAVVKGLVVQKFAGNGIRGTDWVIESNEVRLNHGYGIAVERNGIIRGNYVHDNGQLGIGMTGDTRVNDLVENNEIAFNNYAGYCPCWEAGGIKYTVSTSLTIRGNYVHHNQGPGIWIDYDNDHVVIENNRVENNSNEGVIVEASFNTVVRNNAIKWNGLAMDPAWMQGAAILNESSANVDVYGNTVEGNLNGIGATQRPRGTGQYGAREVQNFSVHGNTISMAQGRSGLVETTGNATYYTGKGNRFWDNTYALGCQARPFSWKDPTGRNSYAGLTVGQWTAAGNDVGRTFASIC